MVRAGAVNHPAEWVHGSYREIQDPRQRYKLIDLDELSVSCGFTHVPDFQQAHREWVAAALTSGPLQRDERWSETIAVGSEAFVAQVQNRLGAAGNARVVVTVGGVSVLREDRAPYNRISGLENHDLSRKITRSTAQSPDYTKG
jgi:putative transposase